MDLTDFDGKIELVIEAAKQQGVDRMLCVSVDLGNYDQLIQLASQHPGVLMSVGVHPTHVSEEEPTVETLIQLARSPHCIAIGETGLDYYRVEDQKGQQLQQARLIHHIEAARAVSKALIIHTRQASTDTINLLKTAGAREVGGVMHCFTETWEVAKAAMDLGFYISFSGIVTFKNAVALQEVAKKVPLDRLLIETDAPYLAPAPYRGQQNQPAWVRRVAEVVAELRALSFEEIAEITTRNFEQCFRLA
jgi:TatD DNase family protein